MLNPFLLLWHKSKWPKISVYRCDTEGEIKYIPFIAYLDAPKDPRGVKRCAIIHLTWIWRFGALIFSQNWKNCEILPKLRHFWWLLKLFWSSFNFGSILEHQSSKSKFSGLWRTFWHPWGPWGRPSKQWKEYILFLPLCLVNSDLFFCFQLFRPQQFYKCFNMGSLWKKRQWRHDFQQSTSSFR